MLTLRDLSLRLGSTVLLDRANLTIERGERVCVLGRNGTGKSTLLKIIAGEVAADEGEIVGLQNIRVARLVQDVPHVADLSVYDVVAQGLGESGALLSRYYEIIEHSPDRLDELGRIQARIDAADAWNLDQRVHETLSRLSLPGTSAFSDLSGGLKRRVLLGQALVQDPDLLLLDEPTNHLDIEAIAWLEEFLIGFRGAILFVTHDRAFLRRLATRIVELDRGWLTSWPGDYDNYLRRKEERAHAEAQEKALFDKRLAQEEAWIRQGVEARRTRNQGRVERLREMRDAYRNRRNSLGAARMEIQEADRSGKLVVEAENISYAVGERTLVRQFSTTVQRGDKIGILGPNGVGKTTLINLLLGRLQPDSGEVRLGSQLQIAYFDQLRAGLDENLPVFENLGEGKDFVDFGGQRKHVMGYLQDFLFTPDRARSPVRILSGGERNRLLLARLFAKPSNLLILDEPTNDLDLETLELLEELLLTYEGTVLLVSHDRDFVDHVVTRSIVFEGAGRVAEYVGGYSDVPVRAAASPAHSDAKPATPAAAANRAPSTQRLNARERRELEELPARIERWEEQQVQLADQLSSADFQGAGKEQALKLQAQLAELDRSLAAAYARWDELESLRVAS